MDVTLTGRRKQSFCQEAVVSILLHGCTTWTLLNGLGKKLDGNYTRMLRAILNKSWRQDPTKQQLYGHLLLKLDKPDMAIHCRRRKDENISDILQGIPSQGREKACRAARTYLQHLCADTGYTLEDLPGAMDDRKVGMKRVTEICAGGATRGWLWHNFPGQIKRYVGGKW